VQVALFTGFLSAFLVDLLNRLEPKPMDIIQDVLIYQTQMMRNLSLGPYDPPAFSPPDYIVVVSVFFYASLGVLLLAAFIILLIKSWLHEFDRGTSAIPSPEQRAKTREFRYLGTQSWKLPEIIEMLPLLIHLSLFLFSIGLVVLLFHINKPTFLVTTAVFGVGVFYYSTATCISVLVPAAPFRSPISRLLGMVYQSMHAHFCPGVDVFLSSAMDISPATVLGRVHRRFQIFFQKSRPYLEGNFAESIAATTMGEVQLSTAASALARIHDIMPDSQESEEVHWSVWQLAGSTTFLMQPLFNIPYWILKRGHDEAYVSRLPLAMAVSLVAVSVRVPHKLDVSHITSVRNVLQRVDNPKVPWFQLVVAVFDRAISLWAPEHMKYMKTQYNDLTNMIRRNKPHRDQSLWLLSTLSELHSDMWLRSRWLRSRWLPEEQPFLIGICLAILLGRAPEWNYVKPPDIVMLEAVVTLAAISCSPDMANRLHILTSGREHPWLLLNIRNPALFGKWFEDPSPYCHKQLISLLFLVVYALMHRGSYPLAVQYFTIITAKGDLSHLPYLPLYASALTAIAPSISYDGLSIIGRMLVAPQQELMSIIHDYGQCNIREELFRSYDHQLGASENPDPSIFVILLMLSKHLDSYTIEELQNLDLELKNPWLRLAARLVAQLDIPDGSGLPMGLYHDHRVQNMIAALSLLRYTEGDVTQYIGPLLLASFLESREVAISSVALEYYMETTISYPDLLAPPRYLSAAVSAAFSPIFPGHQLWMGWRILYIFVGGFEQLSVEWRRAFAEGFFTLSRQPLPQLRRHMESSTRKSELEEIITWEYFHKEERERELTDSDVSGLDWMSMAWSLHLSQPLGRDAEGSEREGARSRNSGAPAVNEEFVLRALCRLLDAAPYYQIIPIIPKLHEFLQWFDDTELSEYRSMISSRVREAVGSSHRFHKFHCTWFI
jgi:hypothetical protein